MIAEGASVPPWRLLVLNRAQDPRENPYAPDADWATGQFDFFEASLDPVSIPYDPAAFAQAKSNGVPLLADASASEQGGAKAALSGLARLIGGGSL